MGDTPGDMDASKPPAPEMDSSTEPPPPPPPAKDAGVDAGDGGGSSQVGSGMDGGGLVSDPSSPNCRDGFARGTANAMARDVKQTAPTIEGVAVCPNGNVFVSAASHGEVWRIPLEGGDPEVWATLPDRFLAGLACDDQNRVLVADYGNPGTNAMRYVVRIAQKGDQGTLLPNPKDSDPEGYNGVLFVPGVGIYASNTEDGEIVLQQETAPGTFTAIVAAKDVPGANGLARGPDARIYVALTAVLGDNEIVSFAVGADGKLGDRKSVWKGANVVDGVAVDEAGTVYAAFYNDGKIVRIKDGSTVGTATNPASLAFKGGTLFYTDFDLVGARSELVIFGSRSVGHLWAVDLGVCGVR